MTATAYHGIGEARLPGGSFYGVVAHRQKVGGAIFSELRHSQARKLPAHCHEMPFFCLFLEGDYGEKYGRQNVQFRPFTFSFRPADVPHMDEVGRAGRICSGSKPAGPGRRWSKALREICRSPTIHAAETSSGWR